MRGMGQIVSWSVRDESLHCEGMIKLFHEFVKETECMSPKLEKDIIKMFIYLQKLNTSFSITSAYPSTQKRVFCLLFSLYDNLTDGSGPHC